MNRMRLAGLFVAAFAVAALQTTPVQAQKAGQTLGTVKIPKSAMANGQALAGRDLQRATGGRFGRLPRSVRRRKACSGSSSFRAARSKAVSSRRSWPAPKPRTCSRARARRRAVQWSHTLKGNDYMRVWINHGGKNYLIHLTTTPA